MRTGLIATSLAFLTPTAVAQDNNQYLAFGVAKESCATWLASRSSEFVGTDWIMGFWTGANFISAATNKGGETGDSTDGNGIVAEIKKLCAARPSDTIVNTAITVFLRFHLEKK